MTGEKNSNLINSNLINVKNVTKKYGKFCAVDNITLSIKKGELIGFLGLNGAGKSTTMDMLTNCLDPTSGTIEIGGHNIAKNPVAAKKMVGYLPDTPPLYNDMLVGEYLKFVCDLKGIKNIKKEVDRIISKTALEEKRKKLISTLSKGYRQRVGLAQALIGDPTVLILDEPTSGLDPSQVVAVRNLLKELAKNHTVILSTHILSEVENICDRVLIINKGRLIANDVRQNLSNKGDHTYALRVKCKNSDEILKAIGELGSEFMAKNVVQLSDGMVEFDLTIADTVSEDDIYLKVSKALISRDISVVQFKNVSQSLEKIFLSLVERDNVENRNKDIQNKGIQNKDNISKSKK